MRRKDREMPKEFALEVVDKCIYATLATVNEDNSPYCMPITIVRKEEYIYFHCAKEGHKIENMKNNSSVCISCVGNTHVPQGLFTTEFESAVVFGSAQEIENDDEKIAALRILCERHTPGNMDKFDEYSQKSLFRTAVWKVKINEITGKRKKYDQQGKEMKFGRME